MGGRACEQVGEGRGAPDPANKHNVCVCSERGERGPYRMFHEMGVDSFGCNDLNEIFLY